MKNNLINANLQDIQEYQRYLERIENELEKLVLNNMEDQINDNTKFPSKIQEEYQLLLLKLDKITKLKNIMK